MCIYIEVDTNDADYVGCLSEIPEKDLEIIKPLIEAIKNFKPYTITDSNKCTRNHDSNYPIGEVFRLDLGEKSPYELYPDISEEAFETFGYYCPSCDWGFHTIEKILLIDNVKELL